MNLLPCPYDDEICIEDQPDTWCDNCKQDRARDHAQDRYDTFD